MSGERLQDELAEGPPPKEAPVGEAIERIHTIQQMETPKSVNGVFDLPCGYINPQTQELVTEVQVREITGNEEDMLASRQIPSHTKITQLLSGCVLRVGDETNKGRIAQIVQDMLVGDRVFLIFCIRRVTLGDDLPVREKCPECGTTTLFMVNLAEDLKARPMADPMKRIFDVELPSGKTARFRVSTGADEARLAKLRKRHVKQSDGLSQAILMRLELLEGEKPTLQMVKSLGMRDRHFLREQFEASEGGVDTSMEFECPSCEHEWEKELDLSAANFFFPGDRRRP